MQSAAGVIMQAVLAQYAVYDWNLALETKIEPPPIALLRSCVRSRVIPR